VKVQLCCFSCDQIADNGQQCEEESPPVSRWPDARRAARQAGWLLKGDDLAYCPEHKVFHR
jgi:hypothetical protein